MEHDTRRVRRRSARHRRGRAHRGHRRQPRAVPESACSRRPTRSAARRHGPAARCGSRTTRTCRRRGGGQSREGDHVHHVAVARHDRAASSSRPTSTPDPRWSRASKRRRRCSSTPSPACPDYHPEYPGGSPGGGRTIECPIYPFDELGEWADRVTPSPYYADPHITMSETPLGKAFRSHRRPKSWRGGKVHNERGCGQALIGRLLRACLDRGIEPRTSAARTRARSLDDGAVVGVDCRDAPTASSRSAPAAASILATGGFEWNRRARAGVPARSDDAPGLDPDQHR